MPHNTFEMTTWESIRFRIVMFIAGDVITRLVGAAILPFIEKEQN